MTKAKGHRDLVAWQEAMSLVTAVYRATQALPREEQFGLTAQMRRAATSVPSNIAEGAARRSRRDFANFLRIDRGSLAELETQLEIARNLGFLAESVSLDATIERLFRLIAGLLSSLNSKNETDCAP